MCLMLATQNPAKVNVSPKVAIREYGTLLSQLQNKFTCFLANLDISDSKLFGIQGNHQQALIIGRQLGLDLLSRCSHARYARLQTHIAVAHFGTLGLVVFIRTEISVCYFAHERNHLAQIMQPTQAPIVRTPTANAWNNHVYYARPIFSILHISCCSWQTSMLNTL